MVTKEPFHINSGGAVSFDLLSKAPRQAVAMLSVSRNGWTSQLVVPSADCAPQPFRSSMEA